jgi:hypothetical protein
MSSRSGNSTNVALIFGGISLISIAGLCLYLYKGKKTIDHKGFKKHIPDRSVTPDTKETEEDAAEALKKKEEALLKETYDDALRFAKYPSMHCFLIFDHRILYIPHTYE